MNLIFHKENEQGKIHVSFSYCLYKIASLYLPQKGTVFARFFFLIRGLYNSFDPYHVMYVIFKVIRVVTWRCYNIKQQVYLNRNTMNLFLI
jgi:hypothetical protein